MESYPTEERENSRTRKGEGMGGRIKTWRNGGELWRRRKAVAVWESHVWIGLKCEEGRGGGGGGRGGGGGGGGGGGCCKWITRMEIELLSEQRILSGCAETCEGP